MADRIAQQGLRRLDDRTPPPGAAVAANAPETPGRAPTGAGAGTAPAVRNVDGAAP